MTRHRPVFQGERFSVLDWQVSALNQMLGKHADAFELLDWFFALDHELTQSGEVLPPLTHTWLRERTYAEARRRGLPLATTPQLGKLSSRLLSAVDNLKKQP